MISQGFEVFKSKLKYRGFCYFFFREREEKRKINLKPNQTTPPPALAETKQIKELKKRFFSWRFFFSKLLSYPI